MPGPATVLCVCTSNVCRSPAAELLLRAGLAARLGEAGEREVRVHSAGTWAGAARPIESGTAAALRALGLPEPAIRRARSSPLRPAGVAGADLILAAAAEHVRAVWRLRLDARRRTFTLGELAALVPAVAPADLPAGAGPAERLRAFVALADGVRDSRRRPGEPVVADGYDLPDPTDDDRAQGDMVRSTAAAVDLLLDLLVGPPPRRPGKVRGVPRAVEWCAGPARQHPT